MLPEHNRSHTRILLCLGLIGFIYWGSIGAARAEPTTTDSTPVTRSWLQTLSLATWHSDKGFASGDQVRLTFSTNRTGTSIPIVALPGLGAAQTEHAVASFPLNKTMQLGATVGFRYPQISPMGAAQGFTNASDSGRIYGIGFIYHATRDLEITLSSERALAYGSSPLGTLTDTRAIVGVSLSFK